MTNQNLPVQIANIAAQGDVLFQRVPPDAIVGKAILPDAGGQR